MNKFLELLPKIFGIGFVWDGCTRLWVEMQPIQPPTDEDRELDRKIADMIRGVPLYEGEPEYMQTFRYMETRTLSDDAYELWKGFRPFRIGIALGITLGGFAIIALWIAAISIFL